MLSNFCHGLCGNGGVNSPAGKVFSELSIDSVNVTSEAESDLFKVGMYSLPYLISPFPSPILPDGEVCSSVPMCIFRFNLLDYTEDYCRL